MIASRPISDFVEYSRFSVATLRPFTKEQALQLVDRLVFRPDDPQVKLKFAQALDSHLYRSHESFASNPLLLNFTLMTFERYADVPAKMHKFYEKAYEVMAETHDASKGAYVRTFETGFDADRMEDYLAEFCARTYIDEKYDLPVRKAREYYNSMNIVEDDGKDAPKFPAFMKDVCDNLCIMYRENDVYYFMHRSFQEYFCALFFSRQLDEDLREICDEFESNRHRFLHGCDTTFEMLYDMIPDRIQRFVFYPMLKEIMSEGNDCGYWDFLEKVYGDICYSSGNTGGKIGGYEPSSYLFKFLLNKVCMMETIGYDFDDEQLPWIEKHVDTRFYQVPCNEADSNAMEVIPDYLMQEESAEQISECIGATIYVPVRDIRAGIICQDGDALGCLDPNDPENYPEDYKDIIRVLTANDCSLRAEYQTLKDYYEKMRERYEAQKSKKSKLFDRIRH